MRAYYPSLGTRFQICGAVWPWSRLRVSIAGRAARKTAYTELSESFPLFLREFLRQRVLGLRICGLGFLALGEHRGIKRNGATKTALPLSLRGFEWEYQMVVQTWWQRTGRVTRFPGTRAAIRSGAIGSRSIDDADSEDGLSNADTVLRSSSANPFFVHNQINRIID